MTFIEVTEDPESFTIDCLQMKKLERFTAMNYSKNCAAESVNEARRLMMFTHSLKPLESIPPTQHALM